MVRRTISVPPAIDDVIRRIAEEEEGSYSAAVARLVEEATKRAGKVRRPPYVGSGEGPRDLGSMAETYLRRAMRDVGRR